MFVDVTITRRMHCTQRGHFSKFLNIYQLVLRLWVVNRWTYQLVPSQNISYCPFLGYFRSFLIWIGILNVNLVKIYKRHTHFLTQQKPNFQGNVVPVFMFPLIILNFRGLEKLSTVPPSYIRKFFYKTQLSNHKSYKH